RSRKVDMQDKNEAKYVNEDIADISARLEAARAVIDKSMRSMSRVLIKRPHHLVEQYLIRICEEGDKVTLAFKRKTAKRGEDSVSSTYELETIIGDFDITVQIFAEAGWQPKTYQESRREQWRLGDAEISIDEWPWIQPYIEIEGASEEVVRQTAAQLGFNWDEAVFSPVNFIYMRDF